MANYNPNDPYWTNANVNSNYSFNTSGGFADQSQTLDFQNFGDQTQNVAYDQNSFNVPNEYYNPNIFTPGPMPSDVTKDSADFEEEPPLLDELEIYPERILEKTLAVLNPFHGQSLADDANYLLRDTDIAGPIAFCLALAIFLFLTGNKAHFGFVYGLSTISVILMYFLLTLMSRSEGIFTVLGVASVLGYCLLPVVGLAILGVLVSLEGTIGLSLSGLAVFWSSLSASRLFVTMSGDSDQRPLIGYPCALVYGVFALLVVF